MSLSMLEQLAQRFEIYASDNEAVAQRWGADKKTRKANLARAEVWRDAANDLRKAGHDNRDAFYEDVLKTMQAGELYASAAADVLALFITPHIVPPPLAMPSVLDEPEVKAKLKPITDLRALDLSDLPPGRYTATLDMETRTARIACTDPAESNPPRASWEDCLRCGFKHYSNQPCVGAK